ncbi:MAG: hypothetical protein N2511_05955 [Thermodesulfovibrionales bacterium]|nr:hypothetical protein [Thermodesulfovibrionales bacterium]
MKLLLVLFFLVWGQNALAQSQINFSDFEYYVSSEGAFGIYKPKGWKVGTQKQINGRMIYVTDPQEQLYVTLTYLERIEQRLDSVSLAKSTLQNMKKRVPDLKVVEARTSKDRMKTVVAIERIEGGQKLIKGKYTFDITKPQALVMGYEAPAKNFIKLCKCN